MKTERTDYARVIRSGVIYCLRQRGESQELKAVTPLQPYFLVYVRNDGEVRFRYTAAKQILDIYRHLCTGEDKVHEELCDLFNQRARDGEAMEDYARFIKSALLSIRGTVERRSGAALKGRGGGIFPDAVKLDEKYSFKLVNWLMAGGFFCAKAFQQKKPDFQQTAVISLNRT